MLFQLFVMLPASAIPTGATAFYIIMWMTVLNRELSEEPLTGLFLAAGATVILIAVLAVSWLINNKVRDLDGWTVGFNLFLTPIRFPLQVIGCFILFLGLLINLSDVIIIETDREVDDTESFLNIIMQMLFNCCIEIEEGGERYRRSKNNDRGKIKNNDKGLKTRFGEHHIRTRNIAIQLFVMLPLTGLQMFIFLLLRRTVLGETTFRSFLFAMLWILILFVLAMFLTKIKGRSPKGVFHREFTIN